MAWSFILYLIRGDIADKSYGILDVVIEKLENKINQEVDIY